MQCLCHPSPWLKVPTNDPTILIPEPDDFIHLEVIHALDISHKDLQYVIEGTKPLRKPLSQWDQTIRWESLNVNVWEGALESFNPEFIGIECIVSTEV